MISKILVTEAIALFSFCFPTDEYSFRIFFILSVSLYNKSLDVVSYLYGKYLDSIINFIKVGQFP